MNKKIGIITFHAAENFGSALQAYALQKILQGYGFDVYIIDAILELDMQQYNVFRTYLYLEHPKNLVRDILHFPYTKKRKTNFKMFKEQYMNLTPKKYNLGKDSLEELNSFFDIFVCGSDQIWNLNCTNGFVPEFFLDFVKNDRKKISYAPSMPCEISPQYYEKVRRSINRIDYVSVREKQSVKYLCESLKIDKSISTVLDPTLLLNKNNYINEFKLVEDNKKYIFVYMLYDENKGQMDKVIDLALDLSKNKKLNIKYVYMNKIKKLKNAEFVLGIGPKEFLEMIYNAEYVITNSFHATIFSILFEKSFCVIKRIGSQSRMIELLRMIKMEKNLYSDSTSGWTMSKVQDDNMFLLNTEKKKSRLFLEKALEITID